MPHPSSRSDRWNTLLIVGVALVALTGFSIRQKGTAADPGAKTVQVTIDYGDGVEKRFTALPWQKEQTVLDLLTASKQHPRGITYTVVGTGENAMVTQIDDLKNEGGGPKSKNWMFRVNGKEAERGAGSYALSPGDTILWKFTVYEYNTP